MIRLTRVGGLTHQAPFLLVAWNGIARLEACVQPGGAIEGSWVYTFGTALNVPYLCSETPVRVAESVEEILERRELERRRELRP